MRFKILLIVFFLLVPFSLFAQYRNWMLGGSSASDRVALVIANTAYDGNELPNAVPQGKKLASKLTSLNIDVLEGYNLPRKEMWNLISEFGRKIHSSYKAGFIFYLGHGIQINDKNLLVPIDANPTSPNAAITQSIELSSIMQEIGDPNKAKIIVLDACRNNPWGNNWSSAYRSLARQEFTQTEIQQDIQAYVNTQVLFTVQPGRPVKDANPFIQTLQEEMSNGGCMDEIFRRVATRVRKVNQEQIPIWFGYLDDNICFGSSKNNTVIVKQQTEERYSDGNYYVGELENGKRNGYGVFQLANGNRYEGQWKDDLMSGKGIYYYKNNNIYEGDFLRNNFHGYGIFYCADGTRFKGQWRDDKMHGAVSWYSSNGILISYSRYSEGKEIAVIQYPEIKQIGKVIFWLPFDPKHPVTITCGFLFGSLTSYILEGKPKDCDIPNGLTFDLAPGTYTYKASCSGHSWEGIVTVKKNECLLQELVQ